MSTPVRSAFLAAFVLIFAGFSGGPQPAAADGIDALIAAYPDHLKARDGNTLIWRDGTRMTIDDGKAKSHAEALKTADIADMLSQPYPTGACSYAPPARNADPGRIRNDAFFRKMYGDSAADVRARLKPVKWFGTTLQATTVNGVHLKLAAVAAELESLPIRLRRYLATPGGTFNWRMIAGTERLSVHSFGAAVDINTKYTDYWRWSGGKAGDVGAYKNRIPPEIVEVFERHGFIWGGKWYHYDTMHFEYRPELIATAKRC